MNLWTMYNIRILQTRMWKKKKALDLDNTMTLDGYIYTILNRKPL